MDEALKMGKDSAKGSFQLFVARIVSTLILAVTAISVGILIEEADYGLYVIALVPIATFLLFQDWGMGAALTKYCAFHRANKDETNLRKTIIAGLTFGSAIGLALTLLSLLMAGFVASVVLGNS
jgi:O-antigen/teichoic acid export membrane protein